jgi:hypothetical protein
MHTRATLTDFAQRFRLAVLTLTGLVMPAAAPLVSADACLEGSWIL